MRRTARYTLLIVAVLLIAATAVGVLFYGRLGTSIVALVERYGEAATGTDVSLRSADVAVTESRGTLSGLTVGNPPGYESDYALRVDEIELTVDLRSLGGGPLVVDEAVVDGALLNAEQRGASSNLTEILEHMEQEDDAAPESEDRIVIERFRLTNARVTLRSELSADTQSVDLPEVVVEDVGTASGGVSYGEATEALLGPILAAGRTAVRDRIEDAATDAVREELEEAAQEELEELLRQD